MEITKLQIRELIINAHFQGQAEAIATKKLESPDYGASEEYTDSLFAFARVLSAIEREEKTE